MSAQEGHSLICELLLNSKASINKKTNKGISALYVSCSQNRLETVELLLNFSAKVNSCSLDGTSPLYIATQKMNNDVIKKLLDYQGDVNLSKQSGHSPLELAETFSNRSTLTILKNAANMIGKNDEIYNWLNKLNLLEYYDIFIEQDIDSLSVVIDLTDKDLKEELQIKKLAHRKKLMKYITQLQQQQQQQQ
eukprot:TRINITY_DN2248_c0_g2_i2.p1 TRINITY_DN2248_c0_g2~~TRINITY_DN2248_c0_g2_i2.p1  ORF type:complete len:192 (-),score=51.43 TRINITY_DN2248_c0_g2_i2:241-816(-)